MGQGAQKWDALVSAVGEDFLSGFFVSLFFYTSGKAHFKKLNYLMNLDELIKHLQLITSYTFIMICLNRLIYTQKLRTMTTEQCYCLMRY